MGIPNPEIDDFLDSDMGLDTLLETEAHASYERADSLSSTPELLDLTPHHGIDPRLKLISHSSRSSIHKCPKAYQLYRLNSIDTGVNELDTTQGVTFAYGTAVGVAMQSVLEDKTEAQILLDTFLAWDVDLLDDDPKRKKSIWEALFAAQQFLTLRQAGFLEEYELVYYKDKPAIELGFRIILPNGYSYRGFVDAVLRHIDTREVLVLEGKTSSIKPDSAQFKNSGQAIGYSVVLDILFPELSSYKVLYMVYYTKAKEYTEMPFTKTLLQRALWLQDLIIETETLELYNKYDSYPMHGENCFNFFRPCEYLGLCTLGLERLVKPLTVEGWEKLQLKESTAYDFTVDFNDLVEAQITKGEE